MFMKNRLKQLAPLMIALFLIAIGSSSAAAEEKHKAQVAGDRVISNTTDAETSKRHVRGEAATGIVRPPCPDIRFTREGPAFAPHDWSAGSGDGSKDGSTYLFGEDIRVTEPGTRRINPSMASTSTGLLFLAMEDFADGKHAIRIYTSDSMGKYWEIFTSIESVKGSLRSPSLAVGEGASDTLLVAFIYDDGINQSPYTAASPMDVPDFHTHALPVWTGWEGYAKPVIWTDSVEYNAWYAFVTCEGIFSGDNINICAWRSTDYGENWEEGTVVLGAEDTDTWSDPDGSFGTTNRNDYIACFNDTNDTLYVVWSADEGVTWDLGTDIYTLSEEPDHAVDPEIEAAVNHDNVMLCCTRYNAKSNSDAIGYAYSQDGGTTWTTLYTLPGETSDDEFGAALSANEGGKSWHLAFNQGPGTAYNRRPQDLSTAWVAVDQVSDVDQTSYNYPNKALASHWEFDLCCVAWTDFRNSIIAYDIYSDYTGNVDEVFVPTDVPTIQGAMDAVFHGATIRVEPGTYKENIDFKGRAQVLTSIEGAEHTMIDGNSAGSVVLFENGEDENSAIKGFTLRNGNATGGGGIRCENSTPVIMNNIIIDSYALKGGGIYCSSAHPHIIHCTIHGNEGHSQGGALLCNWDSEPEVINSILWNNESLWGDEIYVVSGDPSVHFCDVKGGWPGGFGNIDEDPLFVQEAYGDFHILYDSPCRDAAIDGGGFPMPSCDFEGDPRVAGSDPDMGADEFHKHFYFKGYAKPGGKVTGRLVDVPGTNPIGVWFGTGVLDPPLPSPWGLFYPAPPWYFVGPLGAIPAGGVMDLPGELPTLPPPPYDLPIQALVGDQFTNLLVLRVR
ncbi:MAG: hypothetical protein ACYTG7_09095 [Planctomycetota bacterium]|jgi:hypothetical protein